MAEAGADMLSQTHRRGREGPKEVNYLPSSGFNLQVISMAKSIIGQSLLFNLTFQ